MILSRNLVVLELCSADTSTSVRGERYYARVAALSYLKVEFLLVNLTLPPKAV